MIVASSPVPGKVPVAPLVPRLPATSPTVAPLPSVAPPTGPRVQHRWFLTEFLFGPQKTTEPTEVIVPAVPNVTAEPRGSIAKRAAITIPPFPLPLPQRPRFHRRRSRYGCRHRRPRPCRTTFRRSRRSCPTCLRSSSRPMRLRCRRARLQRSRRFPPRSRRARSEQPLPQRRGPHAEFSAAYHAASAVRRSASASAFLSAPSARSLLSRAAHVQRLGHDLRCGTHQAAVRTVEHSELAPRNQRKPDPEPRGLTYPFISSDSTMSLPLSSPIATRRGPEIPG